MAACLLDSKWTCVRLEHQCSVEECCGEEDTTTITTTTTSTSTSSTPLTSTVTSGPGCDSVICNGLHDSHESGGCCLPYYCVCYADGQGGPGHKVECPPGKVFNTILGYCTSPLNDFCCNLPHLY